MCVTPAYRELWSVKTKKIINPHINFIQILTPINPVPIHATKVFSRCSTTVVHNLPLIYSYLYGILCNNESWVKMEIYLLKIHYLKKKINIILNIFIDTRETKLCNTRRIDDRRLLQTICHTSYLIHTNTLQQSI